MVQHFSEAGEASPWNGFHGLYKLSAGLPLAQWWLVNSWDRSDSSGDVQKLQRLVKVGNLQCEWMEWMEWMERTEWTEWTEWTSEGIELELDGIGSNSVLWWHVKCRRSSPGPAPDLPEGWWYRWCEQGRIGLVGLHWFEAAIDKFVAKLLSLAVLYWKGKTSTIHRWSWAGLALAGSVCVGDSGKDGCKSFKLTWNFESRLFCPLHCFRCARWPRIPSAWRKLCAHCWHWLCLLSTALSTALSALVPENTDYSTMGQGDLPEDHQSYIGQPVIACHCLSFFISTQHDS